MMRMLYLCLSEFKLVAHIPHLPAKEQPTIAIVTLLFCEKVAVDAMMDSKTTYIRIKKGEGKRRKTIRPRCTVFWLYHIHSENLPNFAAS